MPEQNSLLHLRKLDRTQASLATAGMITPLNVTATASGPTVRAAQSTWCEHLRQRVRTWATAVTQLWCSLQITHLRGQYSIERMLALEEYARHTSIYRVLLVLVVSPLPTITIALCQESIPLQDPTDGWRANPGFWIRVGILAFGISCSITSYVRLFLDGVTLSWRQTLLFCSSAGVCNTALSLMVAALWVFPIPFFSNTLGLLWMVGFGVSFYMVLGAHMVRHMLSQRQQLVRLNNYLTVQLVMVCIYPAYQLLFNATNHTRNVLPVILALPLLKVILKKVLASQMVGLDDAIPEEATFHIDFFDALYMATFLQTLPAKTMVVVMVFDVVQTVIELRELHQHTYGILQRIDRAASIDLSECGFLAVTRSLCKKLGPPGAVVGIQVRSVEAHKLSEEGRGILEALEGIQRPSTTTPSGGMQTLRSNLRRGSRALGHCWKRGDQVAAAAQHQAISSARSVYMEEQNALGDIDVKAQTARNLAVVREALKVLFTAECLILTEYLEVVIPLLHAIFLLVMVHLPSAQYHTEIVGVTTDNVTNVVKNIFMYAALELVSMGALVFITWRSCGIRALYQLAFVLETQATSVQCKLIMYLLVTLSYRVAHFGTLLPRMSRTCVVVLLTLLLCVTRCMLSVGADFSFRFEWIGN